MHICIYVMHCDVAQTKQGHVSSQMGHPESLEKKTAASKSTAKVSSTCRVHSWCAMVHERWLRHHLHIVVFFRPLVNPEMGMGDPCFFCGRLAHAASISFCTSKGAYVCSHSQFKEMPLNKQKKLHHHVGLRQAHLHKCREGFWHPFRCMTHLGLLGSHQQLP